MANNTDILAALNEIIDKLDGITIQRVNCGGGCGGAGGGIDLPSDPATEGGAAPAGFEPLDEASQSPEYFSRKCSIANLIHDELRDAINRLDEFGLGGVPLAGTAVPWALNNIQYVLDFFTGPLALGTTVVGMVTKILDAIIPGPDIAGLVTILDAQKATLICDLYSASDAASAISAYLATVDTNGGLDDQVALVESFLNTRAVNTLFFAATGIDGQIVDAALSGYTPSQSCDGCAQTFVWEFPTDKQNWVFVETDTAGGTVTEEWDASGALKNRIDKTSANGVNGHWLYTPSPPWTATASSTLRCIGNIDVGLCSHIRVIIDYSDATSDTATDTSAGNFDLSVTTAPGNVGKTIEKLRLQVNSGSSCGSGSVTFLLDRVEFTP